MMKINYGVIIFVIGLMFAGTRLVDATIDYGPFEVCIPSQNFNFDIKMQDPINTNIFWYDQYTDASFIPGKKYKFKYDWYLYDLCDEVHGLCTAGEIIIDSNPPFTCPDYGEIPNRCAKTTWQVKKDGVLVTDMLDPPQLYRGDSVITSLEFEKPGIYEITATHHGWNNCISSSGDNFSVACQSDPLPVNVVRTFTLTLFPKDVTIIGADIGAGADVATGLTALQRSRNAKEDHFKFIRYFTFKDGEIVVQPFMNQLDEDVKVILVFSVGGFLGSYFDTPEEYAQDVIDILENVPPNSDPFSEYPTSHFIGNKIYAVALGNEEENKWWDPSVTPPAGGWFGDISGGQQYAEFYLAAKKAIDNKFPGHGMKIIGGGTIEKHGWLSIRTDSGYTSQHGSPGDFLRGFLTRVKDEGVNLKGNQNFYMPDIIDIHTYSGHFNPEYHEINANGTKNTNIFEQPPQRETSIFNRLTELRKIITDDVGLTTYFPEFAITEYGFSPGRRDGHNRQFRFASLDEDIIKHILPSEYTQAVYYLRSNLIFSTLQADDGTQLRYSMYWQHAFNLNDNEPSPLDSNTNATKTGFMNIDGTRKLISIVNQRLYDDNPSMGPAIGLNQAGTTNWLKAQAIFPDPTDNRSEGLAWCGWKSMNGEHWAAIWRYTSNDHFFSDISFNHLGQSRSIYVDGDFKNEYTVELYQFDINDKYYQSQTSSKEFVSLDPSLITLTYPSTEHPTKTKVTIDAVSENPIFIRWKN